MKRLVIISALAVLMATGSVGAVSSDPRSVPNVSSSTNSSLYGDSAVTLTDEEKSLAKQWMLEESDWIKYKKLMSGPRGIWSPGLDPLTALGVSETDPEERARYAMIWMKVESRRMELELAFEVERQKAAKKLFGDQPVIDNRQWSEDWNAQYNSMTHNIAFFVDDSCLDDCEELFNDVRNSASRQTRLDVFFNDGATAETITTWARHMQIDPEIVRARQITLNFESGKSKEFGVDLNDLPKVKVLDIQTGMIRDYK